MRVNFDIDDCNQSDIQTLDINSIDPHIVQTYVYSHSLFRPVQLDLVIDSGATGLSISKSFLNEHGYVSAGKTNINTANNRVETKRYTIPDFWVFAVDFGDVSASACSLYGLDDFGEEDPNKVLRPGYAGLLGLNFLSCFNAFYNYSQNEIKFYPRKDYIEERKKRSFFMQDESEKDLLYVTYKMQSLKMHVF